MEESASKWATICGSSTWGTCSAGAVWVSSPGQWHGASGETDQVSKLRCLRGWSKSAFADLKRPTPAVPPGWFGLDSCRSTTRSWTGKRRAEVVARERRSRWRLSRTRLSHTFHCGPRAHTPGRRRTGVGCKALPRERVWIRGPRCKTHLGTTSQPHNLRRPCKLVLLRGWQHRCSGRGCHRSEGETGSGSLRRSFG